MSNEKKTFAVIMAEFFPTSGLAISKALSKEDFDAFTADATEVSTRLSALSDGNVQLKADYEAANTRATTAEASLTEFQNKYTSLETESKGLKENNQKLQGWYDNQKKSIASTKNQQVEGLPDHIAALPENHPNRMAVEAALRNQPGKK